MQIEVWELSPEAPLAGKRVDNGLWGRKSQLNNGFPFYAPNPVINGVSPLVEPLGTLPPRPDYPALRLPGVHGQPPTESPSSPGNRRTRASRPEG
jgi:hypothetical protein